MDFRSAKLVAVTLFATGVLIIGANSEAKLKLRETFPEFSLIQINSVGGAAVTGDKKHTRGPASQSRSGAVSPSPMLGFNQLKGKVSIVDFWASWCEPCKEALPVYDKLYAKYKSKGLQVVGVNVDDEQKNAFEFLSQFPVKFPIVFDEGRKLVGFVDVAMMPTAFVLNKKGIVTHIQKGYRSTDRDELEKIIKNLL